MLSLAQPHGRLRDFLSFVSAVRLSHATLYEAESKLTLSTVHE